MESSNIHILGVGYQSAPIISILKSGLPMDRVYLLWNRNEKIESSKDDVVSAFLSVDFTQDDVIPQEVDAFDYQDVLNNVMIIARKEKDIAEADGRKVMFYINITHGTRLITGALCTASLMLGAQMYYLKENEGGTSSVNDLLIKVPAPKIPDLDKLTTKRREFLKRVCDNKNGHTVSELAMEFNTKQNVNQYVGYFESINLVRRVHEGKGVRIIPTELGNMAVSWLL